MLVCWPQFGLLYQLLVMTSLRVEQLVTGETELLGENIPQYHFFFIKNSTNLTSDRTLASVVSSRRLTT